MEIPEKKSHPLLHRLLDQQRLWKGGNVAVQILITNDCNSTSVCELTSLQLLGKYLRM